MRAHARVGCGEDPCLGGGSVCGPSHQCVVRPGAREDPSRKCRECYLLDAEKESICGAVRERIRCETTLAHAVATCSDVTCSATRAALEERVLRDAEPMTGDPPQSEALTADQVAEGFEKAREAVLACPDGVPGLRIKVRAEIRSNGTVAAVDALNYQRLPVTPCVTAAVKEHARFAPTRTPSQQHVFTYAFPFPMPRRKP